MDEWFYNLSVEQTTCRLLLRVLEKAHPDIFEHIFRMNQINRVFFEQLDFSQKMKYNIRMLTFFHDIGMIAVPTEVVKKEGRLTEAEYEVIQQHCEIGRDIIEVVPAYSRIGDYILKHHEWWNGEGYPLGIEGEEIPYECRYFAVVDALEAMTGERPYQWRKTFEEAVEELRDKKGTQFDPELTDTCIDILLRSDVQKSLENLMKF